ncbi:MAG: DMT family transporter [Gammaproteobacteria bacterium]
MRDHFTEHSLLLLLALIWSASFLLIKIGVGGIGPVTLTAARMCVAALVLGGYLLARKTGIPLNARALLLYSMVGFMGNTLPFILISWGELHIDSSLAAIMMGVMPVTTFALAHFFIPSEAVTARRVFGLCLGFGGLLTLVGLSALDGIGDSLFGQLSVLAGAISYGVTTVFVRTQPAFPGFQMAAGAVFAGVLASVPLAFMLENPLAMRPDADSVYAVVALGVFPTALAALLYFRLIRSLGAMVFSQLNYVIPIFGSLWGVALLGEVLQLRMAMALALVLAGIYFIQSGLARAKPA